MAYLLVKDGQLVLRDGSLVTVPNASGNGDCECCGDPCTDCSGTQGSVTSVRIGGGACGAGVTECNYANSTLGWGTFSSDSSFCYWQWTNTTDTAGVTKTLIMAYNHTSTSQTFGVACSASVPAGQWYALLSVSHTSGVAIRWSKLNVSVSCSGGELSFADTLAQCFNNWVGCGDCGTASISK